MAKQQSRVMKPEEYSHSPIHLAVAMRNRAGLSRALAPLPRLLDPSAVITEAQSADQEILADKISSVIDRRDVPQGETPLHLAVRANDLFSVNALISAGADPSLHNSAGWNALQEAVIASKRGDRVIATAIAQHLHRSNYAKFRRRLPRLVSTLRQMRDFYMEISFHFESSVLPFVNKVLPSDTYRIWKRDACVRADTSLAGFDGLKITRADQSFIFQGESLMVLNRDKKTFFDAFEGAGEDLTDADAEGYVSQSSVVRPGMDVTRAELVSKTNWRGHAKTERVGEWKAKVYDVSNVSFSFRTRKLVSEKSKNDAVLPLEVDEDDDGYLNFEFQETSSRRHSSFTRGESLPRGESFPRGDRVTVGRKSVDIIPCAVNSRRSSVRLPVAPVGFDYALPVTKEKEFVKNLKPSVWLTEDFPLKTEELIPLLDILAGKVKAIRRMREMLTTKFPPSTFPVKFAIPVVPTVKVVITFSKFENIPSMERFYTPLSSPSHLSAVTAPSGRCSEVEEDDPFAIPRGYRRYSCKGKSGNKCT